MNADLKSKLSLILSMFIFGTIGIFRRYMPFGSGSIAFFRGVTGAVFLLLVVLLKKQSPDIKAIKKNAVYLCVSGAFIGFNWMLLFEAYNYTTVATATLCYYMAPIIVVILSPVFLKEKLTLKKGICALCALMGMVLVSGIFSQGFGQSYALRGVLCGLGAAVLYASVMMINQKIHDISAYDKTMVQLIVAGLIILPYTLLTEKITSDDFTATSTVLLIVVGVFHTGFAYALYFGSMDKLSAQTVALFSYIDPIVAVILSALLLREHMGVSEIIGAVLVLGSTIIGEIEFKKRKSEINAQ